MKGLSISMLNSSLGFLDFGVVFLYVCLILIIAFYVSRKNELGRTTTKDYFLAGNSLPWWAIGGSLIASNISAEQLIGMSGSGYVLGMAIASYEWMAAITLLIVGKYMVPIFLRNKIYTMPQFLNQRFDERVKTIMAVFWVAVYIFINLTSILWLGGLAIQTVTGIDWFWGMFFLCFFSMLYSLYGGLKAVAYTDIFQVLVLVVGGILLSYLSLDMINKGMGIVGGFEKLITELPTHFDMIFTSDNQHYSLLPGISVLIGGLWVMNLSYWGFNQYIIQRALAAKNLNEAQKGIAFAAFLKILMPLIVVLPGIAAVILFPYLDAPDNAYPSLMSLMPEGFKGLIFAALVGAIVSSLSSMTNSVSTIFTLDLYKQFNKEKSEQHLLLVGRLVTFISLLIALFVAQPLLGKFEQAFQYVQEFTGFFTPGITVIFLLGLFSKHINSNGALAAAVVSVVSSLLLKMLWPSLPFMDRIGLAFVICLLVAFAVSLATANQSNKQPQLVTGASLFVTTKQYNYAAVGVTLIVAALYVVWW